VTADVIVRYLEDEPAGQRRVGYYAALGAALESTSSPQFELRLSPEFINYIHESQDRILESRQPGERHARDIFCRRTVRSPFRVSAKNSGVAGERVADLAQQFIAKTRRVGHLLTTFSHRHGRVK
jgi:hypothetical protein